MKRTNWFINISADIALGVQHIYHVIYKAVSPFVKHHAVAETILGIYLFITGVITTTNWFTVPHTNVSFVQLLFWRYTNSSFLEDWLAVIATYALVLLILAVVIYIGFHIMLWIVDYYMSVQDAIQYKKCKKSHSKN